MGATRKLTLVVPLYNEEENVVRLVDEVLAVFHADDINLVLVDDGSEDQTWNQITACIEKHADITGLRNPRNLGQSAAMLRGLRTATTPHVATMDGDLQNDPADIPPLLETLREHEVDCVCGRRAKRRDSWARRAASRLANRVRNLVTHDGISDTGCSLKVFRAECVADLPPLRGAHRFMPAYFKLHGRTIIEAPVNHRPRQFGHSKYTNLKRLPITMLDLFGFWWYRRRFIDISRLSIEPKPDGEGSHIAG